MIGLPTYRYQYAGNFSNISPVDWMGAYHSCKILIYSYYNSEYADKNPAELPLIFGTHYEYREASTPFEYEVSHAMEGLCLLSNSHQI
jgi:hypothetical protein